MRFVAVFPALLWLGVLLGVAPHAHADPAPGTLQFNAADYSANASDGTATLIVERVGSSEGRLSTEYTTLDGAADTPACRAAQAGVNYVHTAGTLVWETGDAAPKTIAVPLLDPIVETPSQVLTLSLSNGNTIPQATLTIHSTHYPRSGIVVFNAENYPAHENSGSASITVNRVGGRRGVLSVSYATKHRSAVGGEDYVPTAGTLTWADGDASPKAFTVPLIDRHGGDGSEHALFIQLRRANHGVVAQATLTITDDDAVALPSVDVLAATPQVQAGGGVPGFFRINRLSDTAAPLTVDYTVAGSAVGGRDYRTLKGTRTLKAGQAVAYVRVQPIATGATGVSATVVLTIQPREGVYTVLRANRAQIELLRYD